MGRLTTHVLDTHLGKPAAGMEIELWRLGADAHHVRSLRTNADGRVDGPILEGEALTKGHYELRFHVGPYLKAQGQKLAEPLFLDIIPIRFGISDPGAHYHVPLLVSAHGYSTYRGS